MNRFRSPHWLQVAVIACVAGMVLANNIVHETVGDLAYYSIHATLFITALLGYYLWTPPKDAAK